jgi:protein-S-isoprenylcysteine O-methyltransferase Ste14
MREPMVVRDPPPLDARPATSTARAALSAAAFFLMAPLVMGGVLPWWISRWHPGPRVPGQSLLTIVGAAATAAGVVVVVEAFVRFVRHGRGTPAPYDPARRLVVSGAYRYVRNPMYVGLMLVVLGQALILRHGALLAYALVLFTAFHLRIVLKEEPELRQRFGDEYDEYCRRVQRWIPRGNPATPPRAGEYPASRTPPA